MRPNGMLPHVQAPELPCVTLRHGFAPWLRLGFRSEDVSLELSPPETLESVHTLLTVSEWCGGEPSGLFYVSRMFVSFCAVRLDSVELRCEHGNVLHHPPQAQASA